MHLGAGATYVTTALSPSPCLSIPSAVMDLPPSVLYLPPLLSQGADTGHSSHVSLSEGSKIAQGRAAPAHTSQPHLFPFLCCRTDRHRAAQLLQVWSHPVLLNLFLLPAHTLSSLWRGEASPLPHHGDNEVIGAHDQDLAGGGAALRGRVRHVQVGREGPGVIDQLAQGAGF